MSSRHSPCFRQPGRHPKSVNGWHTFCLLLNESRRKRCVSQTFTWKEAMDAHCSLVVVNTLWDDFDANHTQCIYTWCSWRARWWPKLAAVRKMKSQRIGYWRCLTGADEGSSNWKPLDSPVTYLEILTIEPSQPFPCPPVMLGFRFFTKSKSQYSCGDFVKFLTWHRTLKNAFAAVQFKWIVGPIDAHPEDASEMPWYKSRFYDSWSMINQKRPDAWTRRGTYNMTGYPNQGGCWELLHVQIWPVICYCCWGCCIHDPTGCIRDFSHWHPLRDTSP